MSGQTELVSALLAEANRQANETADLLNRAAAALAQNAQGDSEQAAVAQPVAVLPAGCIPIHRTLLKKLASDIDAIDMPKMAAAIRRWITNYKPTYLHAERARVPELMMERLADAAAALDKLGRRDQCRHLMMLHEMLAVAPSQPATTGATP